jgi:hypothetical protein
MGRSKAEDRKLGEVKAVLRHLQRMAADPASIDHQSADKAMAYATHSFMRRKAALALLGGAVLASILIVGIVGYAFIGVDRTRSRPSSYTVAPQASSAVPPAVVPRGEPPAVPPAVVPPAESPAVPQAVVPRAQSLPPVPALQVATRLMAAGRILAAREELLRLAPEDTADVAWALARTYDPNFLATIPGADAGPNVAEATRWYRTWYAVAVKQGLVGDSVSLDRIIGSMR